MNRVLASRVCGMLVLLALAVTACNADVQLNPVPLETTEIQAVEPQGADITVQAEQPLDSYTILPPSTPWVVKAMCTEGQLVAPDLLEPGADAIVSGIKPSFSWSPLHCDVWGWEFELCSTEDCGASEFGAYLSPYSNIRLGWDLEVGSTHYWRAAAWLTEAPAGTRGPWSETRRLTIKEACSDPSQLVAPTLLHPPADALDSGVQTSFSWSELECHVWGWEFELCATEDCGAPEFEAVLSPYSNNRLGWALEPCSTHYWRAAAWLTEAPAGVRGPWSETRRLTIMEACSGAGDLVAPFLQFPENGSTQYAVDSLAGHRPRLSWTPGGACQPTEFLVELFIDPESGSVLISHRTESPVAYWEVDQDLQIGVTYFWRVAAMLGETVGPFSSPRSFTTIGIPEGQPGAVMGRVWSDVCVRPPGWDWGDPTPAGCEFREGGLSADGEMDAGEASLAGVTVNYTLGACPPGTDRVYEAVTDANGDYLIYLSPGSFCVWLDASAGNNAAVLGSGRLTHPACAYDSMDPCTVEISDGEIVSGFNFGWEFPTAETGALGSISGTVWKDTNANGEHNASEHGLANVEVRLSCVGCPGAGTPTFTSTDAQGNYSFGSLASAAYSVEVAKEFPANGGILTSGGWTRPPVSGTWAAIQVVLAGGEDRGGVDFGWSPLTFFRPAFQLLPTLQLFLPLPTLQLYLASTPTPPTFYVMPSATPRIYIRPTPTRVFIPVTKPPIIIQP
ncbi:MAG: hypothetical protein NTU91_13770, partial [Chloroflexi bacterium]|nr:hypothetical protein [Chloroflexota bacterium]